MTMLKNRRLESPFFEVGPKNYLYGDSIVELALAADRASEKYNIDTVSYTHLDVYKRQGHLCFSEKN